MVRKVWTIAILGTVLAASGATCVPRAPLAGPLPPVAFHAAPTLAELVSVVNTNARRVRTLHTDTAYLSTNDLLGLRTTISVEPPRRLRVRARLFGPEIDLGSNERGVWFWASSDPQRAVYWAGHDQLASTGGAPFPLEPTWLIQAFGLIELLPHDRHEGPFSRPDGSWELRSQLMRPSGPLVQSLTIDSTYGFATSQTVWDANGRVLAQIRSSEHRWYEAAGISLPHRIDVQLPVAELAFQIEVVRYEVNRPLGNPAELWQMPVLEGYDRIDLAAVAQEPARGVPAPGAWRHVPAYSQHQRTAFQPSIRGYSLQR